LESAYGFAPDFEIFLVLGGFRGSVVVFVRVQVSGFVFCSFRPVDIKFSFGSFVVLSFRSIFSIIQLRISFKIVRYCYCCDFA